MSELVVGSLKGLSANSFVIDVATGSKLDLSAGAVFPAGNVVQVLEFRNTASFTTTSTSYVDVTSVSIAITPKSATNKILAFLNISRLENNTGATQNLFRIMRDSTALANEAMFQPFTGGALGNASLMLLDSPATTSAVTYKAQMRVSAGTGRADDKSLILLEVAG